MCHRQFLFKWNVIIYFSYFCVKQNTRIWFLFNHETSFDTNQEFVSVENARKLLCKINMGLTHFVFALFIFSLVCAENFLKRFCIFIFAWLWVDIIRVFFQQFCRIGLRHACAGLSFYNKETFQLNNSIFKS